MGKIAGGAAIAILAVAAVVLLYPLFQAQSSGEKENFSEAPSISFSRAAAVDFGSEGAILVPIDVANSGRWQLQSSAFIFENQPPSSVAWWEGEGGAGAENAKSLRKEIAMRVENLSGWKISATADDARIGEYDYAIIANGAWPQSILGRVVSGEYPKEGRAIIYFGLMDGSAIDREGKIIAAKNWPSWLKDGKTADESAIRKVIAPSGGEIWIVSKAPDEFSSFGKVARDLAEGMALAPQAKVVPQEFVLHDGRNNLVLKNSFQSAWTRIVVLRNGEIFQASDIGPSRQLAGQIRGPKTAQAGTPSSFQVSISPALLQEEKLEYFAYAQSDGGEKFGWRKIGVGDTRERWAGAFAFSDWPNEGDATLVIEDQFRRIWARAFVKLPNYDVKMVWADGVEKEFRILRDGEKYDGEVGVSLGQSQDVVKMRASDGKLRIYGDWQQGRNDIRFDFGDKTIEYSFEEGGGLAGTYVRYGIPAIAIALAAIIVLKPRRKTTYKIFFSAGGRRDMPNVIIRKEEFVKALKSACEKTAETPAFGRQKNSSGFKIATVREVWSEIMKLPQLSKNAILQEDVKHGLNRLAKNGEIWAWGDCFAPKECFKTQDEIKSAALVRMIYEALVQKGIRTELLRNGALREIGGEGRSWEAYCQKFPKSAGEKKIVLVFSNDDELRDFQKRISDGSREGAAAWLALHSGRLKTTTIGKLWQDT